MSVSHSRLAFKVQVDRNPEGLTAHAGVPLVVEYLRALGVSRALERGEAAPLHPTAYQPGEIVESFVAALAAGAKSIDDVAYLSNDRGLRRLLGRKRWPSATTLWRYLEEAHVLPEWQAGKLGAPCLPAESHRLKVLDAANRELVAAVQERSASRRATIDLDATIIESAKREALPHYDEGRGYQPWVALWHETGLVVADEFREGNVTATTNALDQVKRSFAALPASVAERFFRADSAMYVHDVMDWLDREKIGFAITADMSRQFRAACERMPESAWERLRKFTELGPIPTDCEIADIEFQPFGDRYMSRDMRTSRYIAIRKRDEQGRLFATDSGTWYLGLVTNRFDEPKDQVWWWHRQKCGTVERVHDEIKNDLAGGVLPCGRFQANAAWFRLNVIAYNLLVAMKAIGLPKETAAQRPATLRYRLLNLAGRVVTRARQVSLRLPWVADIVATYMACRAAVWRPRASCAPNRA